MKKYIEIKEKNKKRYGTDIGRVGALLLANLYNDRSHFVYELLQNAEDAYERLEDINERSSLSVYFDLYSDRLEFRHNGIPFNDPDVEGICGINEDIKSNYERQIGKFGIGFKSVFAYTKCPKIYSDDKTFCIKNYVWPEEIERKDDVRKGETLIEIPFDIDPINDNQITPEIAYNEIYEKLSNFSARAILFTKKITKINWITEAESGSYSKTEIRKDGYKSVILFTDEEKIEEWLVFGKNINIDSKEALIEIAYKIEEKEDGNKTIVPLIDSKLFVFFPTEKSTNLRFLIQGPYNTTPTREDIRKKDTWNETLIVETGKLVIESLQKIKELNLLNVDLLTTLPIQKDIFITENNIFKPLYDEVKKGLKSDNKLLPTDYGTFVSAKYSLLSRGSELRKLLNSDQLNDLFNRNKWLSGEITQDKTPVLREYIINELEIPEIDSEKFAKAIGNDFLNNQTDHWIQEFYIFLLNQKALWRKRTRWQYEGILLSKHIIRLENNDHVKPFDGNGNVKAYLPLQDKEKKKHINRYFNMVKEEVIQDEKAKSFLKELGLIEPDAIEAVKKHILPMYRPWNEDWKAEDENNEISTVSLEDNLKHIEMIKTAINKIQGERQEELISDIRETEILYSENMSNKSKYYCSSKDIIYLGKDYVAFDDNEIFFDGNEDVWLLTDIYKNKLDIDTLLLFGCKEKIEIYFKKPKYQRYVVIRDAYGNHERGLSGFDPNSDIEGLEFALDNINFQRSLIIWKIICEYPYLLKGETEYCPDGGYPTTHERYRKEIIYSKMGEQLLDKTWLYSNDATAPPRKPLEINLTDLHPDYEPLNNKEVVEKLGIKTPRDDELKEKMTPEQRKGFEILNEIMNLGGISQLESLRDKLKNERSQKSLERSPEELINDFKETLTSEDNEEKKIEGDENKIITGPTPEEEKEIERVHGAALPRLLNKIKMKRGVNTVTSSKIIDGVDIDQFLLSQYDGHCQICNTRLYSGNRNNRREGLEFNITRIMETRNKNPYTNMEWNVLCLCPNHFTLFKYGKKDLSGIWELAEKVSQDEVSHEWIDEREGDFYVAEVKMMKENGRYEETEIFYSPEHMRKITAFIKIADE